MKSQTIPKWKYWLSYLMEVHIESAPSDINPHLYVSLDNGKMQLSTQNAVYSFEDRYDNFRLLFEKIKLGDQSFKRVLVLGLGLGSVPLLIQLSGLNVEHMTMVELDEQVVYLAEKYGLGRISFPYNIYTADAQVFVSLHSDQYDLIISDVFLDDTIPDFFLTKEYLTSISNMLLPNGLFVVNTLASTNEDKKNSKLYFEEVFKPEFPEADLQHVWENYMLMNRTMNTSGN